MTQNLDVEVCEGDVCVCACQQYRSEQVVAAFDDAYFQRCLLQWEIKYFGVGHQWNNSSAFKAADKTIVICVFCSDSFFVLAVSCKCYLYLPGII